jgi:NAD(P)-dependent dehydrogenase (short-subunit alcohol dehydrogenase family)
MLQQGLTIDLQVVDVNDSNSVEQMIERIKNEYDHLDVLVNNAGIHLDFGISALKIEETIIKETFETKFFGALRMTQAVVPLMKQQNYGRIVNLSSGLGAFEVLQTEIFQGSSSAYRISKTMLNALTCLTAQEVANWGIKVNAVCPGRVKTDMAVSDAPSTLEGVNMPTSTVEEGADTAVWLATLDEKVPNGGYFRNRQPINW